MPAEFLPQTDLIPLSKEELSALLDEYGRKNLVVFDDKLMGMMDCLPKSHRTLPVVNFLLHTCVTKGIGINLGKLPESLDELKEDVSLSYKEATGATVAMIINYLRYPELERPVKLSRFQLHDNQGWMNSIELGLDQGFFVLEKDDDTIVLHPQVKELFFAEEED